MQSEEETFNREGWEEEGFFNDRIVVQECAWNISVKLFNITFTNSETLGCSRNSPSFRICETCDLYC